MRTVTFSSSADPRTSSSTPTARTSTRRDRGSLPQLTFHQGAVGGGAARWRGRARACAVVPNLEHEPGLAREIVQARIEVHFREVATGLPFWKRVRTLEFWEGSCLAASCARSRGAKWWRSCAVATRKNKSESQQGPEAHTSEAGWAGFWNSWPTLAQGAVRDPHAEPS